MRNTKRKFGAGMLVAGALTIGGGFLLEGPVSAQQGGGGNSPEVECAGHTFVMKFGFDNSGNVNSTEGSGVTLTDTGDDTWSWTSTTDITLIVLKGGQEDDTVTPSNPRSGTLTWTGGAGISHITFCGPGSSSRSESSETSESSESSESSSSETSSSETSSSETTSSEASTAEVQGESVTNTSAASPVQVAGVQQTAAAAPATLPRTGVDPGLLLMLGGVLVMSGVLVLRYTAETA